MTLKTRRLLFYTLAALFIIIGTVAIFYSSGWRFDLETFQINRLGALFFKITPSDAMIAIDKANFKFEPGLLKSGTLIANLFPKTYTVTISKDGYQTWAKELTVLPSLVTEAPPVLLLPEKQNFATPVATHVKDFWVGPKHIISLTDSGKLMLNTNELFGYEVVAWSDSGDVAVTKSDASYFLIDLNRPHSALNISLVFNNLLKTTAKISRIQFVPNEESRLLIAPTRGLYILDTQKMRVETVSPDLVYDFSAQESEILLSTEKGIFTHSITLGTQESLIQNKSLAQIKKVAMAPSGYLIAMIDQNGSAYLFERKSMQLKLLWPKISRIDFAPNNKKILLVGENKELIIHPIADEKSSARHAIEEPARFNIGSIDEEKISWHENSNYLFIKYPSSLYLLEANNLPPINFQVIDLENKKYQYDEETNAAYLLKDDSIYQIALE